MKLSSDVAFAFHLNNLTQIRLKMLNERGHFLKISRHFLLFNFDKILVHQIQSARNTQYVMVLSSNLSFIFKFSTHALTNNVIVRGIFGTSTLVKLYRKKIKFPEN